ncbi:MAG: 2Fe-2S iron-sulfur cluster binding domain-containing protein [Chitinophagaceae bacterium]|nr:2Fe-2S iron-sulfur cluster binding domain-containing protein [Chitinophagaceae bacterium]
MFKITLKNGKFFTCGSNSTIFEAAKSNGILLEHSCLLARCRSCAVQIEKGSTCDKFDDFVLSSDEKSNNWILSCNSIPKSDILLNIEDLGNDIFFEKKNVSTKIQSIIQLNENVIEVILRLPPKSNFSYNSGQYVNIFRGKIKRSYSIANAYKENTTLNFFIKKYENGLLSNYWFKEAQVNDLLRVEGPMGSFFLRETEMENIIFLATGTGVAPIKAIIENMNESVNKFTNKNLWLFVGARFEKDLFWDPKKIISLPNLKYVPVLSRGSENWKGERGYLQEIIIKQNIAYENAQVYACGSINMIEAAKKKLIEMGLNSKHFFSDAFISTN